MTHLERFGFVVLAEKRENEIWIEIYFEKAELGMIQSDLNRWLFCYADAKSRNHWKS